MAPNFRGAQFSRILRVGFQPQKLRSMKLSYYTYIHRVYILWSSRMTSFVIVRSDHVFSAILAQSAQTRSCQTPKERSPETFRLPQSLSQTRRGEVHAERTAKYLKVQEGVVCKVHGRTKAEIAK